VANMAERIEVLLVVETLGDLGNIVLDVSPDSTHGLPKLLWPLVRLHNNDAI